MIGIMNMMKKTLLATTALAFVVAAQGASAVDVELYGQVNKGVFAFDDGQNTDFVVVDNDLSSTRFGFKGAQALDNGLTASVLFEGEMSSNPSDEFTQNVTVTGQSSTPASNSPSFAERQARVGLSGDFGGLYIGQQSTAIDGALTQDLAGARDVMSADLKKIGGGAVLRTGAGAVADVNGATAGNGNVGGFLSSVGTNRDDSVRYDSPIFAGFQARVSVAQGGNSDAAVYYDGAIADFKVKGALGVYMDNDNVGGTNGVANRLDKEYVASGSVAHSSGLAGTLAYTTATRAKETAGSEDPTSWYAKVGYAWDAFEVAADYGTAEHYQNATANNSELTSMGVGAQYNLGNGVSVAGLYRNFDADVTGVSTDAVDLYGVNMRVKF
jgi:predicted porin